MKKIVIITYHRAVNNGAVLQALGLVQHLRDLFPGFEVKIFDYRHPRMELMELFKIFKINFKKPLFALRRLLVFRSFQRKLPLVRPFVSGKFDQKMIDNINKQKFQVIFAGSDSIWKFADDLFLPPIPNIYWLSPDIKAKKISYAASAYQYQEKLLPKYKNKLLNSINDFDLVSVRDSETRNLLKKIGYKKSIYQIPDPAFFYRIKNTGVRDKLIQLGLDTKKPLFALITCYRDNKIKEITNYFKNCNYQVVALSIYNPLADINLGDELNPAEWAEVFKYFEFCLTDRFHGAIFCIKNCTPFVVIETKKGKIEKSKKYQLLADFDLVQECYLNLYDQKQNISFFDKYEKIKNNWHRSIVPKIGKQLKRISEISNDFDDKIIKVADES
jgi:polysaccharide pyruvyl transferase WcaK-like protein